MLADTIRMDMTAAMRSGDSLRLLVLRMLVSEMNYLEIELRSQRDLPAGRQGLTDEDVMGVIGREVKKRREAIEAYRAGGRQEQAETEQKELEMLQAYLPKQLSEREIEMEIETMLKTISQRDFGQVMKVAAPAFKGRAEGMVVAQIVKKLLSD